MNEIYFSGNTVKYIVATRYTDTEADHMTFNDVIDSYGKPERVTWSRQDTFFHALLYCNKGMIIHAQADQGVGWITYFAPMETEKCLISFPTELLNENPSVHSDVSVDEDPWGFNTKTP